VCWVELLVLPEATRATLQLRSVRQAVAVCQAARAHLRRRATLQSRSVCVSASRGLSVRQHGPT
jgi:hypothetical protein